MTADTVQGGRPVSRIVLGVAIVGAGILFTLDNLGLLHHAEDYVATYWPVALVVIGFAQLIQTRSWSGYAWSLVLVLAGVWILAENLGIVSMSVWTLSPLLLVALGVSIIWRGSGRPGVPGATAGNSSGFVSGIAVMGAFERTSDSADFRGADLVAIMGGIELRIPDDWSVEAHVLPLMGGVADETRRPAGTQATQRLVVRGTVFMGAVEIKN